MLWDNLFYKIDMVRFLDNILIMLFTRIPTSLRRPLCVSCPYSTSPTSISKNSPYLHQLLTLTIHSASNSPLSLTSHSGTNSRKSLVVVWKNFPSGIPKGSSDFPKGRQTTTEDFPLFIRLFS